MAEAVVSFALQQLTDIIENRVKEEVNLVPRVKKEVRYLTSELKKIQKVLDDAEKKQFRDDSLRQWLRELEYMSYDVADVLDEWNYTILKRQIEGPNDDDEVVSKSKFLWFRKKARRRDIAIKIKELKERMAKIVADKDRYELKMEKIVKGRDGCKLTEAQLDEPQKLDRVTTSFVDESETFGRNDDKNILVSKLILEGAGQEERNPRVISIAGVGGIGKTTLAQLVYNDDNVAKYFGTRIWVCVSNVSDELKIVKEIIKQVTKVSPTQEGLEEILKQLENSISKKKFLLVLDDIWEEYSSKWERLRKALKCGSPGSKILITTRSEKVVKMIGGTDIHHLNNLNDTECWSLISRLAFLGKEGDCEKFKDIGMKIAKRCKGLPLAAKVLGGHLQFKYTTEEWDNVLNSEIWQLEIAEVELFPLLILSYNELSPAMKQCFSYCAIFPKDFEIDVKSLVRMWMALGYLSSGGTTSEPEFRGQEYFDNLRMRSFFQDIKRVNNQITCCKMHDIIHDFALFLRKNESHIFEYQSRDPSLISNRIKVYRSFFCEGEIPSNLFDCAAGIRVLRLNNCNLDGIPSGMKKLIQLRYLDLRHNESLEQIPQIICKLYYLETLHFVGCHLKEVPREIGNLIHLTHLDLSENYDIMELPDIIYNLHNLITLNISSCGKLERIPEGIHKLVNLRHFINNETFNLKKLPESLEQLTGLRTLKEYRAGGGWSKLGWLNKLDKLSGDIVLIINVAEVEDIVMEALKAELRNKKDIEKLSIIFEATDHVESLVLNDFLEALQPPPYLQYLCIESYKGTKFPGWITSSSLNHLKILHVFRSFVFCSTLPPLGKLPCLEELIVHQMDKLQFLNRDFLGIATTSSVVGKGGRDDIILNAASPSSSSSSDHVSIAFPKLRVLTFWRCPELSKWEDITNEDEANTTLSILPCLKKLVIKYCGSMKRLPHRLLRKASSLEHLDIRGSRHLTRLYVHKEGAGRRSIPHITRVTYTRLKNRRTRTVAS